MRKVFLFAGMLLASGCSLAPTYKRPDLPSPQAFPVEYGGDSAAGVRATTIGWRTFIQDPRLESLVSTALQHNRNLAVAVARIQEAQGVYRIQKAGRLPEVDLNSSATRARIGLTGGAPADEGAIIIDRYTLGVGVSAFELDFWGRVRNLSEAARSQYLATVQGQRAFRLSLIADVSAAYLTLVEASERIRLAESTVASRREGVRIAQTRFEAGLTSALELRQAESLVNQAEADLAGLRLTRARTQNALTVLVGGPVADSLPAGLPLSQQTGSEVLSPGLPSEVLVARPDVIAAEEQLRAANANIGAARAAFFPSIALTGNFGFASVQLGELFGNDNHTWSFGPAINLPIFNLGRSRGNLLATRARQNIAVANYERTIQVAFQEVADALAGRRYLADQVAAQERGVAALRQIAELARLRYNEGVVRYLEVLDAERSLFAAEQALVQLRRVQAQNLIELYVALGGGLIE